MPEEEKIDPETGKILAEGERLTHFIEGDEWREIKRRLFEKLSKFSAFGSIDFEGKKDADIGKDVKRRHEVVTLILSWIDDIEGIPSQHKANLEAYRKGQEEGYIIRL